MDTWDALDPALQDRLTVAAFAYLKQAMSLTPTLAAYQRWRRGLSPGWQAIQPDEKLAQTWDSLPVLVEYYAAGSPPENWLREALPNLFNMTFAFHQFFLELNNYSIHEFMMTTLSEDDYMAWRTVKWQTSLL